MHSLRLAGAALVATLVVGACGDSTGPQVELSDAEVEQIFDEILNLLDEAGVGGFQHAALFAGAPTVEGLSLSISSQPPISVDVSVGCPGGGTLSVDGEGNLDEDGEDISFDYDITESFDSCVTENAFTFDGSLTLTAEGEVSQEPTRIQLQFDVDGNITVETDDGRSGSCRLDYGYAIDVTSTSGSYEIYGTICGKDIEGIISQGDL